MFCISICFSCRMIVGIGVFGDSETMVLYIISKNHSREMYCYFWGKFNF